MKGNWHHKEKRILTSDARVTALFFQKFSMGSQFFTPDFFIRCLVTTCVLSMFLNTVSTDGDQQCLRWNCPCAGNIKREHRHQKRFHLLSRKAHHTKQKARNLLSRMVDERFRDNADHVKALQNCIDQRDPGCLGAHLDRQCLLTNLPSLDNIMNNEKLKHKQISEFAKAARQLLSTVAVYVEQARMDEQSRTGHTSQSLADDIQQIEEEGIYHILCNLHLDFTQRQIPWQPELTRDLMYLGCRKFNEKAPQDNRNYMIFYTLEKVMHNLGTHFERFIKKRSVDDQEPTPLFGYSLEDIDDYDSNQDEYDLERELEEESWE